MSEVKIPEGYKQTEVGIIPEDWEVTTIGDFAPLQRGFDLPTTKVEAGDYPVVYSNGILRNHEDYQVKGAGIVTGRSGTIGKVHYIENNFWPHNTTLWVTSFGDAHVKFVYYLFKYIGFERFKSGSGVPTLNRNDAHSFKITVPTKVDEQTAIATALSNVDNLIGSLEKLIAKKEAIKTGTMQQLLTGKTRLPKFATREDGSAKGFKQTELGRIPEDWGFIQMGKLGTTYGGLSGKSKNDFGLGNSYYVPFTNVMANVVINPNNIEKVVVNETQNLVISNDLLFNGSSETPEEVCLCSMVETKIKYLYLNSFCFGFRSNYKNLYLPIFLAYWFRAEIGRKAVSTLAQGSTRYNISKSQFLKLNIVLPPFKEQTAIATILSDIDTEIQALQQRLEKTKDIKQGMMQQLLTGKVRLVD